MCGVWMNIYYIRSELSEGRITAYSEKCWLSKLANEGYIRILIWKLTDVAF
jgi:hypothetical protein